jgi:hypothetical protein
MRRRNVAIVGLMVTIAFVFLIPVVQVSYALRLTPVDCSKSMANLPICASTQMKGYASITYWLFGRGGFYETLPTTGFTLSL